jgi:hypothetical protein
MSKSFLLLFFKKEESSFLKERSKELLSIRARQPVRLPVLFLGLAATAE